MPVAVRLARQGARKNPQYMIVAMDSTKPRDGAYLDDLGRYYPKAKDTKDKIKVNPEKVAYWKSKGATFSQTVGQLLKTIAK